jgi:probable F420-dependent oxidoreductase
MTGNTAGKGAMKVGVMLPIAEGEGGVKSYTEVRAYALRAEERGFDSIWLADHLLFRGPDGSTRGVWECMTLLTALAEATERVTLGTLVNCTAFRNPAVLAKQAADVDAISGGRLILGLGAGWHKPEFDAFGLPFGHLASRFDEALQIIVPLLRQGKVDFRGQYYSAEQCELRPAPRPGGPPILIGASKPRMLGLTARHADMWNTCWIGEASALPPRREPLEQACAAEGRDPATLSVTVGVNVVSPGHGRDSIDPQKALAGTPAEVATGLRAYQEQGVTDVICWVDKPTTEALDWLAEALREFRA